MPSITAANAILLLACPQLLGLTRVQGFSPDSMIEAEDVDNAETQMGVDGFFTAGWMPVPVRISFMLSAASPSISFFETVKFSEDTVQDKYPLTGSLTFPSIGRTYIGSQGYLRSFSPFANAGKVLQPRRFSIEWGSLPGAAI